MRYLLILIAFFSLVFSYTIVNAQHDSLSDKNYRRVIKIKDELKIADGKLILINVFKAQYRCLYENRNTSKDIFLQRFYTETYLPYKQVWAGYVGDSAAYMEYVAEEVWKRKAFVESKIEGISEARIDKLFEEMSKRLTKLSGLVAEGKWILLLGTAVTDMGGIGDNTMIVDLMHPIMDITHIKLILPHELNHQIFDKINPADTTMRALYRVLDEGFAVFMDSVYYGSQYQPHEYFMYTKEELQFCMDNEKMIKDKLRKYLLSNDANVALSLANRGQKIFKGGPGAIGYFLGYRICRTYADKYGADSWKDIYRLPVKTILEKSGYLD